MFTFSKMKSIFCLYNDSDEEIMFEWKEYDYFPKTIKKYYIASQFSNFEFIILIHR